MIYHKYTDDDLRYIESHCRDNPADVFAVIGGSQRTVREYMRRFRNGVLQRHQYSPRNYYALYLRKTDKLVCSGSAKDCAEQLGVTLRNFYALTNKVLHGKIKKWDVYIEPYEETSL